MSVLIKGWNMPKNCLTCQFHGFGGYKNELIVCSLTGRSEGQLSNVPDCPLVEVPPHGRLIDADRIREVLIHTLEALKKNPKMDRQEIHLIAAFSTLGSMVENAPTIIEAEEGEEA